MVHASHVLVLACEHGVRQKEKLINNQKNCFFYGEINQVFPVSQHAVTTIGHYSFSSIIQSHVDSLVRENISTRSLLMAIIAVCPLIQILHVGSLFLISSIYVISVL